MRTLNVWICNDRIRFEIRVLTEGSADHVSGPADSWHPGESAEWKVLFIESITDEGEGEVIDDEEAEVLATAFHDRLHGEVLDWIEEQQR